MINLNTSLSEFISLYKDKWIDIISFSPYNIKVNNIKDNYYVLNYNMIPDKGSDFNYLFVRESRGCYIKVNKDYSIEYICRGFNKHFNLSEIDDENFSQYNGFEYRLIEKVDGSLIKLFWDTSLNIPQWNIMTNGSYYSEYVKLKDNKLVSFKDVALQFITPFIEKELSKNEHSKLFTYLFEMVHPDNVIVIKYNKIDLYFLGVVLNNNEYNFKTDNFISYSKYFSIPKIFEKGYLLNQNKKYFYNLADSLNNGLLFPKYEGFMMQIFNNDCFIDVYKVKSSLYLQNHYLAKTDNWSSLYDIVMDESKKDELNEFLTNPNISDNIKKKLSFINDIKNHIYKTIIYVFTVLISFSYTKRKEYVINRDKFRDNMFDTNPFIHFENLVFDKLYFNFLDIIFHKNKKSLNEIFNLFIIKNKKEILNLIKQYYNEKLY